MASPCAVATPILLHLGSGVKPVFSGFRSRLQRNRLSAACCSTDCITVSYFFSSMVPVKAQPAAAQPKLLSRKQSCFMIMCSQARSFAQECTLMFHALSRHFTLFPTNPDPLLSFRQIFTRFHALSRTAHCLHWSSVEESITFRDQCTVNQSTLQPHMPWESPQQLLAANCPL